MTPRSWSWETTLTDSALRTGGGLKAFGHGLACLFRVREIPGRVGRPCECAAGTVAIPIVCIETGSCVLLSLFREVLSR